MKITCTQENFKKAIFNTERVVSKQTTLPILNNILFEADKGGLKLSATNLEIGVVTKIGAKVEKDGKITIPARLISSFIGSLPPGENIILETADQNLKIKSGSVKAVIKGLPASDFPLIPQREVDFQLALSGETLKAVISKISSSVAINETRPELTGVNLILKEKELFFASTDSFRLSENRVSLEKTKDLYKTLIEKQESVIIPATTLLELNRIIPSEEESQVKISIEEGQIFFEVDGTKIVSRLINGKYPEYKHILPKNYQTRAVVSKEKIQSAVRMAIIFTSGKTSEIAVKTSQESGLITIEAKSVEVGENTSELKGDIQGPSQEVVLNAKYLLDGLSVMATSQIALLINSGTSPVALKEIDEQKGEVLDDFVYIVMPIKS
ncbi:MAG: DNA polymerase III subunit beta [Candidatus Moranbacteria bacterium]|nr:DNA polymerase III subunit beta [Candidatus Moranbacteria bacterium]